MPDAVLSDEQIAMVDRLYGNDWNGRVTVTGYTVVFCPSDKVWRVALVVEGGALGAVRRGDDHGGSPEIAAG